MTSLDARGGSKRWLQHGQTTERSGRGTSGILEALMV